MKTYSHASIVSYLRGGADRHAVLVGRDATRNLHTETPVWLDADGVLVHSHPTDGKAAPIAAPVVDWGYRDADSDADKATRAEQRAQNEELARFAADATEWPTYRDVATS